MCVSGELHPWGAAGGGPPLAGVCSGAEIPLGEQLPGLRVGNTHTKASPRMGTCDQSAPHIQFNIEKHNLKENHFESCKYVMLAVLHTLVSISFIHS